MKPILFSTPMVRAILERRKTQTRRVIKDADRIRQKYRMGAEAYIMTENDFFTESARYKIGDILWVRETWADGYKTSDLSISIDDLEKCYLYKADYDEPVPVKWRPSIHMPRKSARIFLRVMGVRVERVQEINETDAIAEGCKGVPCNHSNGRWACEDCMNSGWLEPPQLEFMELWNTINSNRGYSWDANPWVWVYTFELCEKPE